MILVSACLAGINCRYDGTNKSNEKIIKLVEEGKAIPICPEQLSGLTTPRIPSEIKDDKVINKEGIDVTNYFIKGAEEALKLCKKYNCTKVIFTDKSPSCGVNKIYDGTFTGNLINGMGYTTKLLKENGIEVITVDEM